MKEIKIHFFTAYTFYKLYQEMKYFFNANPFIEIIDIIHGKNQIILIYK